MDTCSIDHVKDWLSSVRRDEVVSLQHSPEYKAFFQAFQQLKGIHRKTYGDSVRSSIQDDMDMDEDAIQEGLNNVATPSGSIPSSVINPSCRNSTTTSESVEGFCTDTISIMGTKSKLRRLCSKEDRIFSIQHLDVDDVLLSIFEFLPCTTLSRLLKTCRRFHHLAYVSAEQRTIEMRNNNYLDSPMKLLRAKEQIDGVQPTIRTVVR